LPNATKRCRKWIACGTCCADCSRAVRPVFGEARFRAVAFALEDIEQAVAGNEAADDRKDAWPHGRAATSAASIAVRFLPICRASM
jgi:hypothetical protein